MVVIILICIGFRTSYHRNSKLKDGCRRDDDYQRNSVSHGRIIIVWGFVTIVPLAFFLLFGTLDAVFFAELLCRLIVLGVNPDID